MLRRIGDRQSGPDNGNRSSTSLQRGGVGDPVDAFCKAADHEDVLVRQKAREFGRSLESFWRGVTSADDGYARMLTHTFGMPGDEEMLGRVMLFERVERPEQLLWREGLEMAVRGIAWPCGTLRHDF